jgi:hypothetical protein
VLVKTTLGNAALDLLTTAAGATPYLQIWTSCAAPTGHVFAAAGGLLLSTHAMFSPIGPAASGGVLTLSAIATAVAAASGVPGGFRIITQPTDTDGSHVVAQGTCGIGSGELNVGSSIDQGGTVTINLGFTITNPSAA